MHHNGSHLLLFPGVAFPAEIGTDWSLEVQGWRYDADAERHFRRTTAKLLRRSLKIDPQFPDPPYFQERAYGFVVDNLHKAEIKIRFDEQPPVLMWTKRNGHFRGQLRLTDLPEHRITYTAHGTAKTNISAATVNGELSTVGTVHLPDKKGLTVISDIDDTIKFSNVSSKQELLANSFLRSFRSIEGMPELFQKLAIKQASFHYISATPWQMYAAITRFLVEHQFPEGSVHLRKFALKDATILKKLFPAYKKKRKVIENLLTHFPQRKFLLFGDTGEKDPETYGEVARKYPHQILGICVRNVSPDAPDSLRFRRAFAQIPQQRWIVYEDALRLEEFFLTPLLAESPAFSFD